MLLQSFAVQGNYSFVAPTPEESQVAIFTGNQVYLSILLSILLSNYLSFYLSNLFYIPHSWGITSSYIYCKPGITIYPSVYPSIYLSFYLSILLCIYPSIYRSFYLSILLSIYPFIYLSIYIYIAGGRRSYTWSTEKTQEMEPFETGELVIYTKSWQYFIRMFMLRKLFKTWN